MSKSKLRSIAEGVASVLVIDPGPAPSVAQARREMATRRRQRLLKYRQVAQQVIAASGVRMVKSNGALEELARREEEARKSMEGHPQAGKLDGLLRPQPFLVATRFLRIRAILRAKPFSSGSSATTS